jgi:hypothetical protein
MGETLNLRTGLGTNRQLVLDQFKDPKSNVDAMVTSMAMGAYGLNLHEACHHGIVVQFPHSANTLLQCIGRLVRPNQRKVVDWVVLKVMLAYYL